jgi:bacillithiol synthase
MLQIKASTISYSETNAFTNVVTDYLAQVPTLESFYNVYPTVENIKNFIGEKKTQVIDRVTLVQELHKQYVGVENTEAVLKNIQLLADTNTYTVCTAHQPIIFGGPLYFIYKIAQTIKLCTVLKESIPENNFVPIYYMGSEDADMDEIGTCNIDGRPYAWKPLQAGACGRISTDTLHDMVNDIIAHLNLQQADGLVLQELLQNCYCTGKSLDYATLQLVHFLFGAHGLVTLIPDNAYFKKAFIEKMRDEILHQSAMPLVEKTSDRLAVNYKSQAFARPINLFYLGDGFRERIELEDNMYKVLNTPLQFTEAEILIELEKFSERFSPNVILRGVYQETILPNVAFIGGGGELAYWLQLKEVFAHHQTPYPPLVLRQSFLIMHKAEALLLKNLYISEVQIFNKETELHKAFVMQSADWQDLQTEHQLQAQLLESYKNKAERIMPQLLQSMKAYEARYNKMQLAIEKKFIAHSKRKQSDKIAAISKVKNILFPKGSLQERHSNFLPFYNTYSQEFIESVIANCKPFGNEFIVLQLDN